jgi:transposase
MFNEAGGVPKKLTSDNPKCFSTEASKFEPILNPGFERFCSHYGVIAEMLPPADPEKKGKVERSVSYIRRLYEAYGEFVSIEDSQKYLDKKVAIANERKHGTTRLRLLMSFCRMKLWF